MTGRIKYAALAAAALICAEFICNNETRALSPPVFEVRTVRNSGAYIQNLEVEATALNRIEIRAHSSAGAPDADNPITIAAPTDNGRVYLSRGESWKNGASTITLPIESPGGSYWGRSSVGGFRYPVYLHAIADGGEGIVWALAATPVTEVNPSAVTTALDYLLLEDGSTYSRSSDDKAVAVAELKYQFHRADYPDYTFYLEGFDIYSGGRPAPHPGSGQYMALIYEATLTENVTAINIVNLNGDYDHSYRLELDAANKPAGPVVNYMVRFNWDAGANYDRQYIRGYDTTAYAGRPTAKDHIHLTFSTSGVARGLGVMEIPVATSGRKRIAFTMMSNFESTEVTDVRFYSQQWTGTGNIQSIQIIADQVECLGAGTVIRLYALR